MFTRARLGPRWLLAPGLALAALVALGLSGYKAFSFSPTPGAAAPAGAASAQLGTAARFAYLSQQHSNSCGLQPAALGGYPAGSRLQGSCCSAMNLQRYQQQVRELKQYRQMDVISPDPYDIPVSLANRLISYDNTIRLTSAQQSTYDSAMKQTPEKGPCCCKCWRWYMHEGLAKYLISKQDWHPEQVAKVIGLEDGCGGGSMAEVGGRASG